MKKYKVKLGIEIDADFDDWMNDKTMNKKIIEQLILSRLHDRSFLRETYYCADENSYDGETVQLHTFVNEIDFS